MDVLGPLYITDDALEADSDDPFASDLALLGSQPDLAPLQNALAFDGLDPMLWADLPSSMPNGDGELENFTGTSKPSNLNNIKSMGMASDRQAPPGCEHGPWSHAAAQDSGLCNDLATVPGIATYASLVESINEVDDTGAMLDTDDGTALGQADSSAAGSGKHGSTATHHEEGENSSPLGCIGAPSKVYATTCDAFTDSFIVRSLSAGNIPVTARAHAIGHNPLMCKMELEVDTGLPPGWMTAHTSNHPLSNHCPGATNVELLEAPEEIAAGLLLPAPSACGRSLGVQGPGGGNAACRMADMSSINASWQMGPACLPAAAANQLHTSFMIPNESASCWPDSSSGLSEHHQENRSLGAWSTAATEDNTTEGDGSDGRAGDRHGASPDAGARRSLRATRSLPNFGTLAFVAGTHQQQRTAGRAVPVVEEDPSDPTRTGQPSASGGTGAGTTRRVIIHRWPEGNPGPSLARKSRAAEELGRSGAQRRKPAGTNGSGKPRVAVPHVTVPTPCISTAGSLADLASPPSSAPSSALTMGPARLMSAGEVVDGVQAVDSAGGQATEPSAQPARHQHNLRGRTAINHAALHEGTAGYGGKAGGGWVQQHPQLGAAGSGAPGMGDAAAGVVGLRTSRLPEVPPPQTHGGKKRGASGGPGSTCARPVPHPCGNCCTACGTTVTPVWRAGPQGPKTLCNACGVRYMKVAKRK